jgi:small subunit ribosomal protein S17e
MGRIRGSDIKDVVMDLLDKFPEKFTDDFEHNKKAIDEFNFATSKKQRNRLAGYMARAVIVRRKRPVA